MPLTAKYVVHNPHRVPVSKKVKVEGHANDVHATLEGFEVELMSQDNMSGTIKLRYFGDLVSEAVLKFQPDAVVTVTFEVDAPVVAAEEAPKAA